VWQLAHYNAEMQSNRMDPNGMESNALHTQINRPLLVGWSGVYLRDARQQFIPHRRVKKVNMAFAFCEQRFKLQFHFLIRPRPGQTSMQSRIESTTPEAAHEKEIFN